MPTPEFYKKIRQEVDDKKKIAVQLEEAIKFGEETGNVDPTAKEALVQAKAQIRQFETALKARGY